MRYAELRAPVQDHVRNLRTQLFELARKYGKKDPNDLRELVENGDIPMEDVERITSLMLAMTESFKGDTLSGKEGEKIAAELELWKDLIDDVRAGWNGMRNVDFMLSNAETRASAVILGALADEDPSRVDATVDALGGTLREPDLFFNCMATVWMNAGQLDRAFAAAKRMFPGGKQETVIVEYAKKVVAAGDIDRVLEVVTGMVPSQSSTVADQAIETFLFTHHREDAALRLRETISAPSFLASADLAFARYYRENGGDPRPSIESARDQINLLPRTDHLHLRMALACEFARLGDWFEANQLSYLTPENSKFILLAPALADGGHFAEAVACVDRSATIGAERVNAYFEIARREIEAGIDPKSCIEKAEAIAGLKWTGPYINMMVCEAADVYVAIGQEKRVNDACQLLLNFLDIGGVDEKVRGRLFEKVATMMTKKEVVLADPTAMLMLLDKLANTAREQSLALLRVAEVKKAVGLDPLISIRDAWIASRNVAGRQRIPTALAVTEKAWQLGVPTVFGWNLLVEFADERWASTDERASILVARAKLGLPIGDWMFLIEDRNGRMTALERLGDDAKVAHALFEHATKTLDLLSDTEQRRIRRRFGIMEPLKAESQNS